MNVIGRHDLLSASVAPMQVPVRHKGSEPARNVEDVTGFIPVQGRLLDFTTISIA